MAGGGGEGEGTLSGEPRFLAGCGVGTVPQSLHHMVHESYFSWFRWAQTVAFASLCIGSRSSNFFTCTTCEARLHVRAKNVGEARDRAVGEPLS